MSKTTAEPLTAPSNPRFPVMPANSHTMGHLRSSSLVINHRNMYQPRSDPSIDEWEAALIGKYLVKASAADTTSPEDSDETVPADSVRGILMRCIIQSNGALWQLPSHIIIRVEQIVRDNVRLPDTVSYRYTTDWFRHDRCSNPPNFLRALDIIRERIIVLSVLGGNLHTNM